MISGGSAMMTTEENIDREMLLSLKHDGFYRCLQEKQPRSEYVQSTQLARTIASGNSGKIGTGAW
jgi:hypothetical protein